MKWKFLVILLTSFFFSGAAQAQAQTEQAFQHSPELKKLDYFAGTWKTEAQINSGPFGPGGAVTVTSHDEWMEGGYFLISHSDSKTSFADAIGLGIMGYDTVKNAYFVNSCNSNGTLEYGMGMLQGDTWTWASEQTIAGHALKARFTQTILSPASFSIKLELSQDGGNWFTYMEGKATRQ